MARDPKRVVLDHLKRSDTATTASLAKVLGVTSVAVRQHLEQLESSGLVERLAPAKPQGRGRPAVAWCLTDMAADMFPDRHVDLTLDLIASIRDAVGEDGLDKVLASRAERQRAAYTAEIGETPVSIRASSLAGVRTAEGYMAEVIDEGDNGLLLIEHHCPICSAAQECQGICRDELETFQHVFAGVANVEREQHLLSGNSRCAYRIRPNS